MRLTLMRQVCYNICYNFISAGDNGGNKKFQTYIHKFYFFNFYAQINYPFMNK